MIQSSQKKKIMDEAKKLDEIPQLREIEASFGTSAYYADYLNKWKFDHPEGFMKLLLQLKDIVAKLKQEKQELEDKVKETKTLVDGVIKQWKDVKGEIEKANEERDRSAKELEGEQATLEEIEQDRLDAQTDLAKLLAALRAAEAAYKAATDTFEEQYKLATLQ